MSIFDAIRNLAKFSSRRVYWAHNKVIVISEDLDKSVGINDIVDFFARNHELRMRTWVVITPNQASELVATKTGLEVVPGTSIDNLFRYTRIASAAPKVDMRTLQANYLGSGTEVVLPVVQIKPRGISEKDTHEFGSSPQVELAGTAYFDKNKLKGILTEDESQALMWFVDSPDSLVLVLHCPDNSLERVSLEMKTHHFSVDPVYQKARLGFNIRLAASFDMVELGCPWQQRQQAIIRSLEQQAEHKLTHEITSVIAVSQRNETDFLGFGERFEDRYPAEWKQVQPIWNSTLSSAKINVHVTVHIHSPVLLQTPTAPKTGGNTYP